MYHMLPLSYKPEIRSSRRQHGAFQNKVAELVDKILNETEIVDTDHPTGSKLFNAMDTFFSYGLLTADKCYWRFIRQFMPRAEKEMLIAECGNANDRYLSICWLKSAFNKGTLHFQLLALNNPTNKNYLRKFYHVNSCICNNGLLEAITGYVEKLQNVQFAFYSQRQMRPIPAQAVLVDSGTVRMSTRAQNRQRKLTETEASSDTVLNVMPTEMPAILNSNIDQEVLLDELIRNRVNRINSERASAQRALYKEQEKDEEEKPVEPLNEEKLEDVMVKTMSIANMDTKESSILQDILNVEPETEDIYQLGEGEVQLQQGDVLQLAINVFEKSSERVIQTYMVYDNFYSDSRVLKYMALTNYNIYIFESNESNKSSSPDSPSSAYGTFKPLLRMPHDRITTVKTAFDQLSLLFVSNEEGFIAFEDGVEKADNAVKSYWAIVCSYEAGFRLLQSILNIIEHTSREVRSNVEVDDHVEYMCMFQPTMEKHAKIIAEAMTTCFWYEQDLDDQKLLDSMSGYLYKRNVGVMNNWLLRNHTEAEQKYCMITGSKMYIFVDSTCREGEQVIDLSGNCEFLALEKNSFMIKSPQGSFEFEAMNNEEFSKWETAVTCVIRDIGNQLFLIPTLSVWSPERIVIVQEGEKFWNDGFLRFINDLEICNLMECVTVIPSIMQGSPFGNHNNAICFLTKKNVIQYFVVRFPSEVHRLEAYIKEKYQFNIRQLDKEFIKTSVGKRIHDTCRALKTPWLTLG